MKKKILAWLLFFLPVVGSQAENPTIIGAPIELSVFAQENTGGVFNPSQGQSGHPRSPISCPFASIDDHTLYLYDVDYPLTLVLIDENEDVVYTINVPANTASVILPSTLTGIFEIQLYPGGDYYFAGEIEL